MANHISVNVYAVGGVSCDVFKPGFPTNKCSFLPVVGVVNHGATRVYGQIRTSALSGGAVQVYDVVETVAALVTASNAALA